MLLVRLYLDTNRLLLSTLIYILHIFKVYISTYSYIYGKSFRYYSQIGRRIIK